MESFENRMERLTPEQRREVEDFVDFLLLKNNFCQSPATSISPPPLMMNTLPILSTDPAPSPQQPLARIQDLVIQEESRPPMIIPDSVLFPVHEIADNSSEDYITRDYMDYGQFEPHSSSAKEAVKNVKRRIIAREAEEKSGHLLDWVD